MMRSLLFTFVFSLLTTVLFAQSAGQHESIPSYRIVETASVSDISAYEQALSAADAEHALDAFRNPNRVRFMTFESGVVVELKSMADVRGQVVESRDPEVQRSSDETVFQLHPSGVIIAKRSSIGKANYPSNR